MQSGTYSQAAGALIRTREGRITFWSPEMEQRYGFVAEEALGRMSHELLRPSHWQSVSEIEAILAERSEWSGGLIAHRIDGQPVMVANYWHLHAGTDDEGSALVTEVHTDIVDPGTPASRELADVVTTIAQELSQPLAAISGFVGGAQRSVQRAWPDRGMLDRGLADATTQIACAGEMLSRVRALGEALRQPRSRDLHARLTAAITRSARAARQSQELHIASSVARERAVILQNIQVFRRRVTATAASALDTQTELMLRRLLAEEEAKLAALDRQGAAGD